MKPAAILDIGSSKVVCLCGSNLGKEEMVIHGTGVCACDGYRDGAFQDRQGLHDAIIDVVKRTEQESRLRIRDVALTVPSEFATLILSDATITLGKTPREAQSEDIDRLIAVSLKKCSDQAGYVLMHSTPVFFMVDGISSAEIPEGVVTDEVSALVSHMFVREEYIKLVQDALDDIGVEISMCISAQLAEAVMMITETERVRPAVLIDVGYMQTDICVAENTALTSIVTLPIGGYHFASDLAFGLEVPIEAAEQAKRRFVFSLDYKDKTEVLRSVTGSKRVAYSAISFIIEARATELAGLIAHELERMGVNLDARPAVYLTGGGLLMMRGSLDFMKRALHINVKRDMPWTPKLSSPNYCSAFGALDFVLKAGSPASETAAKQETGDSSSLLKNIRDFFTK